MLRVLLVTRRVGEDELAACGGEIAVRDVDRDPLLALRLESVGEQRKIDRPDAAVPRRRANRGTWSSYTACASCSIRPMSVLFPSSTLPAACRFAVDRTP